MATAAQRARLCASEQNEPNSDSDQITHPELLKSRRERNEPKSAQPTDAAPVARTSNTPASRVQNEPKSSPPSRLLELKPGGRPLTATCDKV